MIKDFTDLKSWQECHKLVLLTYKISGKFPVHEKYGLTSQITRSAVSVTSNIVEGFGRYSYKEKLRFYYIARGSIIELINQAMIARDLSYISKQEYRRIKLQYEISVQLLNGLINTTRKITQSNR